MWVVLWGGGGFTIGRLNLPRGCGSNEATAKATASCAVCCVNVVRLWHKPASSFQLMRNLSQFPQLALHPYILLALQGRNKRVQYNKHG